MKALPVAQVSFFYLEAANGKGGGSSAKTLQSGKVVGEMKLVDDNNNRNK